MGTETKLSDTETTTIAAPPKQTKTPNLDSAEATRKSWNNAQQVDASATTSVANAAVPHVPLHIDENEVIQGARDILAIIRPQWDLNAVQFKTFTDGITNKLVGCFNNRTNDQQQQTSALSNGSTSAQPHTTATPTNGATAAHDNNDDSGNLSDADNYNDVTAAAAKTDAVILVRVYGNKTDLLIDRKAETRNFILLHAHGFAPSLYATFNNGLVYDYVPGVTLNTNSVQQTEIWRLVACRMAEMHRVLNADKAAEKPVPMLWQKMHSFFELVPERFSDASKQQRLEGTFLPISRIRSEFVALYRRLETLGSPVVFAHNDLLLGNVIYTATRNTVNFIDYEYADYNFQAFDIGNHFAEFAGVDVVDYALYPSREFQFEWLRVYLQTYRDCKTVSDAEVQRLYVQVNQFALAAHFFWTIWSLIQAEHSTIDFDYVDYAFVRYNEYLAKKNEFLSLDINECIS